MRDLGTLAHAIVVLMGTVHLVHLYQLSLLV